MMEQLLRIGADVQVVCLESSGRNALDFTLAYYLGRAVIADPAAYFHIVSKDKGYDPLIAHLKSRHVRAYRHDDFKSVRLSQPQRTQSVPAGPLLSSALAHLKRNASNRPRRRTTLTRNLQNALGNGTSEADIASLIDRLLNAGHLSIDDKGRVTYML